MSFLSNLMDKAKSYLGARPAPVSATDAVRHDRFDAEIFEEMIREAPPLAQLESDLSLKHDYTHDMVRDVMQQFWQSEPELRKSTDMDQRYLINHAVSTDVQSAPETQSTRQYTKHDKYGATMATIAAGKRVKEFLEKNPELADDVEEKGEEAEQKKGEADQAAQDLEDAIRQAQEAADQAAQEQGEYEGEGPQTEAQAAAQAAAEAAAAALQGALDAAQQAGEAADQAQEACAALGAQAENGMRAAIRQAVKEAGDALEEEAELFAAWGVNDGELQKMSFEERAALAQTLRNNRLSKFRELIGRFRMMAAAQRTKKTELGRDEVYTTELSGDLSRVLGSEFVSLASSNQHMRRQFFVKLMEGQLLSRKYRGEEKVGNGAIICCVDTSGSMASADVGGLPREAWAKAFALALLDEARRTKRDFVAISFSSERQQKMWQFPNGGGPLADVLAFTEHMFNGGTNYDQPMDMAIDVLERQFNGEGKKKGDIVFITDDECSVEPSWMGSYLKRKERLGFRVFGMAVGMRAPGSTLTAMSDNVRSVVEFADPSAVADVFRVLN